MLNRQDAKDAKSFPNRNGRFEKKQILGIGIIGCIFNSGFPSSEAALYKIEKRFYRIGLNMDKPIPIEQIESIIILIRGQKVILDRHLAQLYGVTTGNLNKAVKRNIDRFPTDFMFQLTSNEYESLGIQFGILERGRHSK